MPELPELEVLKEVLQAHIVGQMITEVEIRRPLVLRDLTGGGFAPGLVGRSFTAVARRGKFQTLGVFQETEALIVHGVAKGDRTRIVAGIGNGYADEIYFHARLYPFRKRPTLSPSEAIVQVRQRMGADIHTKPWDSLAVHGKGGQPCPRCTTPISEIRARRRLTNFCRRCQPGSLIAH